MASETVRDKQARQKRATDYLVEIALRMEEADSDLARQDPADLEAAEAALAHVRDLICRTGWLAELALIKLGETDRLMRGGKAENWLLPPAYRDDEASHA